MTAMRRLDVGTINILAPYPVWYGEDELLFKTDHHILYSVAFERDEFFSIASYWFRITNRSGLKSPGDSKIRQTVIVIIEEFFRKNPDILLYLCDSENEQQAQRDRLFLRWFNGYEQKMRYLIRSKVVMDEGTANFVSLIVPRSHPMLEDIVAAFDSEIAMFQSDK